ncbi:MAG: hypothetical protein ACIARQ_10870 [Phycisphaerales bacterium JB061]
MVLGLTGEIDTNTVVPVVVGAHIRAEISDRPTAQWLADQLTDELADACPDLCAVVCTDLWYLNDDRLQTRPTVSVGEPELNAYAAFLADKLPDVYSVKDVLVVQMDLRSDDTVASCWGRDAISTRQAAQAFAERYLSGFVESIARQHAAD